MVQDSSPLDLMQIPLDGIAAYWLSLRKLAGSARNLKSLEDEASYAADPFIRHLLSMALSSLSTPQIKELAATSMKSERLRLDRQLDLMRVTILDIATGENPLRTLAKLLACLPVQPEQPETLLEEAQERLQNTQAKKNGKEAYTLDLRQSDERLCVTLLFYAQMARRHSKAACRSFLAKCGSTFFADGLALVVDGFDAPFVRKWLKKNQTTLGAGLQRKMELSTDLCLAIHGRMAYEDMLYIVKSYLR